MSSVESGPIGPKLVSAPNPQHDESPESICYCPECGARVRLVSREPEDEADRSTLPDWLPPASEMPSPTTSEAHAEPPTPLMSPVGTEAIAPSLVALPLLSTRPPLPPLPSLPPLLSLPPLPSLAAAVPPSVVTQPSAAPVTSSDDEDEPTRVVTEYATASTSSSEPAPEQPTAETRQQKPPPPIRQHAVDSVSQPQAHPATATATAGPQERSEVAPAVTASNNDIEPPSPATTSTAVEQAPPSPVAPVREPPLAANAAHDYPQHISVQSTSPTARDLSVDSSESEVWKRRPKRTALLLSAGLGGAAVALGFSLSMRTPAPAPTLAAAALPVAAIATAPVQLTATNAAPSPTSETAEQPAAAISAKPAKSKAVPAPAHEVDQSESATRKSPVAEVSKPVPEQPEESADEEEPFDAYEAARAVDAAAERASACRREDDPSGVAVVTITFAPSGRVTTATLAGPPFLGTPTGSCIASTMRSARVSAFAGKHMTVRKTVTIH